MTGGTALQSDPIEKLAETLYWKLEHLDPTFGEFGWENLEEDTREIYRICIRYLLTDRNVVLAALETIYGN